MKNMGGIGSVGIQTSCSHGKDLVPGHWTNRKSGIGIPTLVTGGGKACLPR